MKGRLGWIAALAIGMPTWAQNLVPNPGFETQTGCPAAGDIEFAQPWNSPSLGTPDLFNSTCATQNAPGHTGIGSAGIFLYHESIPGYREYIQAPLTSPLVTGQMYHVAFWVRLLNFKYACSSFGAYLKAGAVNSSQNQVLAVVPQIEHPHDQVIADNSWHMVSGDFVATGGEDHIIIGSFDNDASTILQVVNPSQSAAVFYLIDDVSVTSTQVGVAEVEGPSMAWGSGESGDALWIDLGMASDERPTFSLYDLSGRQIPVASTKGSASRYEISAKGPVPNGLYVLRAQQGSITHTVKVPLGQFWE